MLTEAAAALTEKLQPRIPADRLLVAALERQPRVRLNITTAVGGTSRRTHRLTTIVAAITPIQIVADPPGRTTHEIPGGIQIQVGALEAMTQAVAVLVVLHLEPVAPAVVDPVPVPDLPAADTKKTKH